MMDPQEGRVLLINKPYTWTSFDVVNKLRYLLKTKKIGHAGTLDPLATGLLIICTGKKTKEINSFMGMEKEYTGRFILGQTTPSYDLETKPSEPRDIAHLTRQNITDVTKQFLGTIEQLPPAHSAIKINGKRAYEFARAGNDVALKPRPVEIRTFEITSIDLPSVSFRVVCSKGTYIRSLARDVGDALGVGAYLSELCRTRIGDFLLEKAQTLEAIKAEITGNPE